MSDIREKIMAIEHPLPWDGWPHNGPFLIEAFERGLSAAADIAEAEVARLEERVRELEKACASVHDALGWITEDMDLIGDDKILVDNARSFAERVIGGE